MKQLPGLLRERILAGLFFAALVCPIPAGTGTLLTSFQNGTGETVVGLEAIFIVPISAITQIGIVSNPADAGPVTITDFNASTPQFNGQFNGQLTGFDLTWGAPGLPTGESVQFAFGPGLGRDVALISGPPLPPFWTTQAGDKLPAPPVGPGAWSSFFVAGPPSVPEPPSFVLFALGVGGACAAAPKKCRPRSTEQT